MDDRQINVDPLAIENGASTLESFAMRLRDFDTRIEKELSRLSGTFQGEEYDNFFNCFLSTRTLLESLSTDADKQAAEMREHAQIIHALQNKTPKS